MQPLPPPVNEAKLGITAKLAAQNLAADGYNELPAPEHRGFLRILAEVLREPMFMLLLGGGVVYLILGNRTDALLLLMFACLSVSITIVQEIRSENVLEALRNLASPRALVIRDGKRRHIAGREVVCEDVMVVSEGDRVPADARLLSCHDLMLDESLLTGESEHVAKQTAVRHSSDAAFKTEPASSGDHVHAPSSASLFAGTLVVRGTGWARVYATGVRSEMGKIGGALSSIDTEQPHLRRQVQWLVRDFAILGAIAGGLVVLLYGLLRGSWLEALLGGIALGMSMLPQEFPLVMAVFMAMGAWRISQARVLTRRASAIESLGATTVLCTDKTGTLTENRMTVVAIQHAQLSWLLSSANRPVSTSTADQHTALNEGQLPNNPLPSEILATLRLALLACPQFPIDSMDIAIHTLAVKQGSLVATSFEQQQLVHAYALRPELAAVANLSTDLNTGITTAYAKGGLEAIALLCRLDIQPAGSQHAVLQKPGPQPLAEIRRQVEALAKQGIRVLALASSEAIPAHQIALPPASPRDIHFNFRGLIGFADPLRKHVAAAIAECHSAGIRVLMITGDYPTTAVAIGKQAGLLQDREASDNDVLSGDDIEAMSDQTLAQQLKTVTIFARIRPQQKLRIVQSLKANGHIVGMTGDGVNDAPAIKAAHIGIAMGGRGTDVAREAAAIVLLDDDFNAIVKTIRLGRRIYDNLRKAIEYIVAVHIPIAGLALLPLLLGMPLMLTPIHIAFLEMVIDPACSIVFEAERAEKNVMRRPPRRPKSPLLLPKRIVWAVLQGLVVLVMLAGLFILGHRYGMAEDDLRALVFTTLVLMNIGLILINRSLTPSLADALLRPNRSLWLLIAAVLSVLAVAISWAPAQQLFHFGQLHGDDLIVCAAVGTVTLLILAGLKWLWFAYETKSR